MFLFNIKGRKGGAELRPTGLTRVHCLGPRKMTAGHIFIFGMSSSDISYMLGWLSGTSEGGCKNNYIS